MHVTMHVTSPLDVSNVCTYTPQAPTGFEPAGSDVGRVVAWRIPQSTCSRQLYLDPLC